MKRWLWPALLALLLLVGQSGLPQSREMGEMALLRTVGVDSAGAGYALTVSTGRRARGVRGEEKEPPLVLSAARPTLTGAALALEGHSDRSVFFGYVDQLILGEDLVRRGCVPLLDWIVRGGELGIGTHVWVARGRAADAVSAGGEEGAQQRLDTLTGEERGGIAALTPNAGEVYTALLERGAACVPALTPAPGGELLEEGYAVLTPRGLSGYLTGEEARGLELLAGGRLKDVVELPGGAVCPVRCRVRVGPAGQSGRELVCSISARLGEGDPSPETLARLERDFLRVEQGRARRALTQLQRWGTDCLALSPAPGGFETAEMRVRVTGTVLPPE